MLCTKELRLPIFGYTFFGNHSGIFGPIGNSGDYYLSICDEESKLDAYFPLLFEPLLAGKWAWPPSAPLIVLGLQTQPKCCRPFAWAFWVNYYVEIMLS